MTKQQAISEHIDLLVDIQRDANNLLGALTTCSNTILAFPDAHTGVEAARGSFIMLSTACEALSRRINNLPCMVRELIGTLDVTPALPAKEKGRTAQ